MDRCELLSFDLLMEADEDRMYSREYLNSLNPPGFPQHKLVLAQNASVMLLRNLDAKEGHVNGSRYAVKEIRVRHILLERADSTRRELLCPRIDFMTDENYPFSLRRRQFPVTLAFAITSNKSQVRWGGSMVRALSLLAKRWRRMNLKSPVLFQLQGQTLERAGIYLDTPFFTHGQLYVALSRVGHPDNVRVFLEHSDVVRDEKGEVAGTGYTRNTVYREILHEESAEDLEGLFQQWSQLTAGGD